MSSGASRSASWPVFLRSPPIFACRNRGPPRQPGMMERSPGAVRSRDIRSVSPTAVPVAETNRDVTTGAVDGRSAVDRRSGVDDRGSAVDRGGVGGRSAVDAEAEAAVPQGQGWGRGEGGERG